ncbi:MAG: DNA-processing protein DprA [Candidatus Pacebacteria bacterium]|nr:DNA-processing protein DprA [Candidatus Paceibacterota bacterium]
MEQFEIKNYNALNIFCGADYRKLKNLIQKYGSWTAALENIRPNINSEEEWQKLEEFGIKLILKESPEYPFLLKEIDWPPFGIYMKGNLSEEQCVAIVGTRKATSTGIMLARQIAKKLSENDLIITSGLAIGIDASSHQGALDSGSKTIAVLPTGLDKIYPSQNQILAEKIIETGGALISEYPLHSESYPSNFIHRNRIVSGLSIATIIIEAPERSGTLATARFALEQNREIFVAPGPANHPNYIGSHSLIRAGARLATSAEEIMEDLNINYASENVINAEVSLDEKLVLEAIKQIGWPASIDKISEITKIGIPNINQIITFLTIKGLLK